VILRFVRITMHRSGPIFTPKRQYLYPVSAPALDDPLPGDGFRIIVSKEGTPQIHAVSHAGKAYAERWLSDMRDAGIVLEPDQIIEDWPDFERRGFMLDISRNRVPTMAWLKELIDRLSDLRYNELQLYTEHTFAYAQHESVWRNASPMTAEEIRELDRYCRERHIELVPNQNSFGHMERWLCHSEYKHLAESPDGFQHPISGWRPAGSTLYPSKESIAFLDALYAELLPNFTAPSLHVGGDEPWELGQGRSKSRVSTEGKHRVYLDFMKRIFALAHKHGCQAQFWADIVLERPDLVSELPHDVMPVIWGYEADSPFEQNCRIVSEAGFGDRFYVAPGAGNWNSFGGRLDVARANIELAARAGKAQGARGLLLTAWGDNGHHQPWPTLFPALLLAAKAAWGNTDTAPLEDQIDAFFYPAEQKGHGTAICRLGRIDACLPQPAPPNSFLHSAFFAGNEALRTLLKQTNATALHRVLAQLEDIHTEGLDPEIQLGIDLNRFAAERCLAHIETGNLSSAKPHQSRDLEQRFKSLWLRRSRPGGLDDSLRQMAAYRP